VVFNIKNPQLVVQSPLVYLEVLDALVSIPPEPSAASNVPASPGPDIPLGLSSSPDLLVDTEVEIKVESEATASAEVAASSGSSSSSSSNSSSGTDSCSRSDSNSCSSVEVSSIEVASVEVSSVVVASVASISTKPDVSSVGEGSLIVSVSVVTDCPGHPPAHSDWDLLVDDLTVGLDPATDLLGLLGADLLHHLLAHLGGLQAAGLLGNLLALLAGDLSRSEVTLRAGAVSLGAGAGYEGPPHVVSLPLPLVLAPSGLVQTLGRHVAPGGLHVDDVDLLVTDLVVGDGALVLLLQPALLPGGWGAHVGVLGPAGRGLPALLLLHLLVLSPPLGLQHCVASSSTSTNTPVDTVNMVVVVVVVNSSNPNPPVDTVNRVVVVVTSS